MAVEPGQGILAHRYANGTLQTYVALNKPEAWINAIDFTKLSSALERIAEEFEGWAPHLRTLITDGDTEPVVRPIYALPIEHRWERVRGVTVVGDAAHLMSPFAGEGANLAIYDGADLGNALCAYLGDIEVALKEYEEALVPRSASVAEQTAACECYPVKPLLAAVSVSRCVATPDKSQSWAIPTDGGRDSPVANRIHVRNSLRQTERPPEVEPRVAWRK
jgi:hypothetical protein